MGIKAEHLKLLETGVIEVREPNKRIWLRPTKPHRLTPLTIEIADAHSQHKPDDYEFQEWKKRQIANGIPCCQACDMPLMNEEAPFCTACGHFKPVETYYKEGVLTCGRCNEPTTLDDDGCQTCIANYYNS